MTEVFWWFLMASHAKTHRAVTEQTDLSNPFFLMLKVMPDVFYIFCIFLVSICRSNTASWAQKLLMS